MHMESDHYARVLLLVSRLARHAGLKPFQVLALPRPQIISLIKSMEPPEASSTMGPPGSS